MWFSYSLLSNVQDISWTISLFCRLCIHTVIFPILVFLDFVVFLFVLKLLQMILRLLNSVFSLSLLFLYISRVHESFHILNPQCWWVIVLFLFWSPSMSSLVCKTLYSVLSLVSLPFGSSVWFIPLAIYRKVAYLAKEAALVLILWWDFSCKVRFWKFFVFFFRIFSLICICLMLSASNIWSCRLGMQNT